MGDIEAPILRVISDIADIDAAQWDACANPPNQTYDPFLSYDFFFALEKSESAIAETGWQAQHLIVETQEAQGGQKHRQIEGVMPLYLKAHSQGEYVFDHGWAEAFYRAGGRYYPKLLCAIPFTPVAGRRLLVRAGQKQQAEFARKALISGAKQLTDRLDLSSLHINFLPATDWQWLSEQGFLQRIDQQFHWQNEGYQDFDDFLDTLSSRKRKTLKKERKRVAENDIHIEWLTGDALNETHWEAFYSFYTHTGARKWGQPYLTRAFFSMLHARMADKVLLIMAKRGDEYIAGALNLIGDDTLYGRNWGCIENHPFLHFECCYYQAIDFAIAHKLARVEAGAQGTHKLARGYLPVRTHSAHYIPHHGLRAAVAHYLEQERQDVDHNIDMLNHFTPFRKNQPNETDRERNKDDPNRD